MLGVSEAIHTSGLSKSYRQTQALNDLTSLHKNTSGRPPCPDGRPDERDRPYLRNRAAGSHLHPMPAVKCALTVVQAVRVGARLLRTSVAGYGRLSQYRTQ